MLEWYAQLQWPLQVAVGGLIVVIAAILVWLVLTAVLLPVLAMLNKLLAPVENSTSMSDHDYLLGTLTLGVAPGHTGEVMVQGGGRARQTYPAKLWQDTAAAMPQGTQVVVVAVRGGIAYVERLHEAANKESGGH